MTQKESIQNLTDCLLQKTGEVRATGLYDGKAGLSLSLFIASGYLQDERAEDRAYSLLQESLVVTGSNLSFETGLSGIGYALLCLLENDCIEADFDDIFGRQYKALIHSLETIEKDPERLLQSLQTIYFLAKARSVKPDDSDRIQAIIKKIFEGVELFLTLQFHDFTDIHYISKKANVLQIYRTYLKLVDYAGYAHFSRFLLDNYATLYRRGRIAGSLETGFFLNRLTGRYKVGGYEDIIGDHISYGIKNVYPVTLSMREGIDLAKVMDNMQREATPKDAALSNLIHHRLESVILYLQKTKEQDFTVSGYGAGLARLLIFYVNRDIELL